MIGYPLDSHVTYKADGTPICDRAISSAPLRKLTKNLFSDGVLPNPSTNMQVTATTGNTVKILSGFALCNGCQKLQEIDMELALPASDASLDRIDTVVLRLDDNDDVRACEFYVVSGTPASTPQAPALTRMGSIWELGLANIYRKANATEVSNSNITDTRYDSNRCGIISSISKFDTTTLYQQIEADLNEFKTINEAEFTTWFENLQYVLSEDVAGELYNLINEVKGNVGNLEELKTSNKSDVVSAINEVKDGLDNAKVDTLVSMEEVEATTDNTIPVGAGAIKQLNESLVKHGTYEVITQIGTSSKAWNKDDYEYNKYSLRLILGNTMTVFQEVPTSLIGDTEISIPLSIYVSPTYYASVNVKISSTEVSYRVGEVKGYEISKVYLYGVN